MSSKLPKTLPIDKMTLSRVTTVNELQAWLARFVRDLDLLWDDIYDQIENGGAGTPNWDIKEAKAADVTAGDANAVGDLMVKHKTTGTERLFESTA